MKLFKSHSLNRDSISVVILSILLVIVGFIISSFVALQTILKNEEVRNKQCSECLNNVFNEEIDHIKNYMIYLKDKIATEVPFSLDKVEHVLAQSRVKHPFYMWNNFGWVDINNKLVISSEVGKLNIPIDFSKIRSYLKYTTNKPGTFFFSAPAISVPAELDLVIPIGLGVMGYDGEFYGTLVATLNLEKLKKRVEHFIESCNGVNYIILNENGKPVIYSNNIKIEHDATYTDISNKLKSRYLASDALESLITIERIQFGHYYKVSDNPFYILTGTNKDRIYSQFISEITLNVFEFFFLGSLFSLILLYYRKRFITPITRLVKATEDIARGEAFILPQSDIYEIDVLTKQVGKIKDFNVTLQKEIMDKTFELQNSLDHQKDIMNKIVYYIKLPIQYIKENCYELSSKWLELKDNEKFAHLMVIKRDNLKANELLNNISDLISCTHTNNIEIKNHININEIAKKAIKKATIRHKAECKEFDITLGIKDNLNTEISCDPDRIEQVILNLLDNSVRYSNNQAVIALDIDVFEKDKNYILIIVKDNGIGIPTGEEELIFKPFMRSTRTTLNSTKGLGLALCRKILELHKGDIWFENSSDIKGAVVKFILPYIQSEVNSIPKNIIVKNKHGITYLSERESECAYLIAIGKSMKEAANILNISPRTVETYLNNVKEKLQVKYKSELISVIKTYSNIFE